MYNQLRIEVFKLRTSALFYILLLFFAVIGAFYGIEKLVPLGYNGNKVFLETIGDTSFMFVITLFVCFFIGNDFDNRTIQNEIKIGHSRRSVVMTRGIIVLPVTAIFHLVYVFSTTLTVGIISGFGMEISTEGILVRVGLVFVQVMAVQCFALLIMFVCKKGSLGTVVGICFTAITCNIVRNFLGEENLFFRYTSFYRIMMNAESISTNEIIISFMSAMITLVIVLCITCAAFQKSELK